MDTPSEKQSPESVPTMAVDMLLVNPKIGLSPRLVRKLNRSRFLQYARVGTMMLLFLIQTSYLVKILYKNFSFLIADWSSKVGHNKGGADATAATTTVTTAATTAAAHDEEIMPILQVLAVMVVVLAGISYFISRLVRPLNTTGRRIFYEGCVACICVLQISTAAFVFLNRRAQGRMDSYSLIVGSLWAVVLVLTAITSSTFLELVEHDNFNPV